MTTTMCSMPESSGGGREAWPKLWANASGLGEPVAPTTRATPDAPAAVKRKSRRLMRTAVTPFWIYLTWTPREGASDSRNVERDFPKQSGIAGSEEQLHAGSKQERNPGNRSLKGVPCQTVLPYRKEIVVVFLGGFDSALRAIRVESVLRTRHLVRKSSTDEMRVCTSVCRYQCEGPTDNFPLARKPGR